eukprot:scaffold845_cov364-Prasinococcus_capsulatus_cf.AAC.23
MPVRDPRVVLCWASMIRLRRVTPAAAAAPSSPGSTSGPNGVALPGSWLVLAGASAARAAPASVR